MSLILRNLSPFMFDSKQLDTICKKYDHFQNGCETIHFQNGCETIHSSLTSHPDQLTLTDDAINVNSIEHNVEHNVEQASMPTFFTPSNKDKLFWIFYVLHHSMDEYDFPKRTYKREVQLKFKYIETIQENTAVLKQHKVRRTNLSNDLGNSSTISVETFIGLCCVHHINVALVRRSFIKPHQFNPNTDSFYIVHLDDKKLQTEKMLLSEFQEMYIHVANLDKPLKSIAMYKLSELQKIIQILDANFNVAKKTKKVLYNEIKKQM